MQRPVKIKEEFKLDLDENNVEKFPNENVNIIDESLDLNFHPPQLGKQVPNKQ